MVAGLPRKSYNVSASSSNHFLPTRPSKEQQQRALNVPAIPELHKQKSNSKQQQFVIRRKKNGAEGTLPSASTYKAKVTEKYSYNNNNNNNNNNKRRTAMTHTEEEKSVSPSQQDRLVLNEAKRRYVLRPQIGYSANSINMMLSSNNNAAHMPEENHYSADEQVVSGILDGITSLCLGPTALPRHHPNRFHHGVSSSTNSRSCIVPVVRRPASPSQRRKKKVVYPIASYPARLNCRKLISERRAVFQQNLFRPVSSDECSHYTMASVRS